MLTVTLHGRIAAGRTALIDDDDLELVGRYRWWVYECQRPLRRPNGPYALTAWRRGGTYRRLFMHTLITGWPRTDHADHNGLNNQRSNLRPATMAQNKHNSRPVLGGSSAFKGVYLYPSTGRWAAHIYIGNRRKFLGCFADEQDAARAYDAAALAAWGEFAYLNFPPGGSSRAP
jgi:hypothetical protein